MKRTILRSLIASLLILVLGLPLFACVSEGPSEDTTATPTDSNETTAPDTEAPTEGETEAPLPTEVDLPEAYKTADIVYDCDDGSVLHNYTGKSADDSAPTTPRRASRYTAPIPWARTPPPPLWVTAPWLTSTGSRQRAS